MNTSRSMAMASTSSTVTHSILLNGTTVTYAFKRSNRLTIGFKIDQNGLTVTAPNRSPIAQIEQAILSKQQWILKTLTAVKNKLEHAPARIVWQDGATFPYIGKEYRLRLIKSLNKRPRFTLQDNWLILESAVADTATIAKYVEQWLRKQASEILFSRLADQADTMQLSYTKSALTNAKRLWGSCTTRGHIHLNWRLILTDWSLMDYVIIHELAHLVEMNHSPRFWAIVEEWYPDWKDARKKLKTLGPSLFTLFPD